MPAVEMFRMLGSGTESVMAAIRVARAHTHKKKIIKVGGAYHGWSDQMVFGIHIPGTGRFEAAGIPRSASRHTQEFYPNNLAALRRILILNQLRGGTAAVILEPLGPESGTRPVSREFNQKVRELCDEFGTLLIFDEVATGFGRTGKWFASNHESVTPDLLCVAKGLSGGYLPLAATITTEEIYRAFLGGYEELKAFFHGHTFTANPLACAAALANLQVFRKEKTIAKLITNRKRLACNFLFSSDSAHAVSFTMIRWARQWVRISTWPVKRSCNRLRIFFNFT